jgi:hypothetical protein
LRLFSCPVVPEVIVGVIVSHFDVAESWHCCKLKGSLHALLSSKYDSHEIRILAPALTSLIATKN